jgi:ADP-dependent NAD(P)H-hydrate dehydratase
MEMPAARTHMVSIDAAALRGWPLPTDAGGHLLVLGGSRQMPGALILAATAALRAGAARLTIATGASVAQLVARALPQARVIALAETAEGGFTQASVAALDPLADQVSAILIGPGMQDEIGSAELVRALLARVTGAAVVLDACAMGIILNPDLDDDAPPFRFAQAVVLTPHAGDMAHLTGNSEHEVRANLDAMASGAAQTWHAVVALKGARTVVAAPDGAMWQHEGGLAVSGDLLAGIIAGLAARGATLEQAACWGVALQALAGELPDEIPSLLEQAALAESRPEV